MLIAVLRGGRIMCGFYLFFAIVCILQSGGKKKKHVFFKSILGSTAFGVRCVCRSPNPQANGEQERKVWVGKDPLQVREVQEKWLSAGSCGVCSLEKKLKKYIILFLKWEQTFNPGDKTSFLSVLFRQGRGVVNWRHSLSPRPPWHPWSRAGP